MPKLRPLESVFVLLGALSFFAGAGVAYLRSREELADRLYESFFAGAGSAFLVLAVLAVGLAGAAALASLARALRQQA